MASIICCSFEHIRHSEKPCLRQDVKPLAQAAKTRGWKIRTLPSSCRQASCRRQGSIARAGHMRSTRPLRASLSEKPTLCTARRPSCSRTALRAAERLRDVCAGQSLAASGGDVARRAKAQSNGTQHRFFTQTCGALSQRCRRAPRPTRTHYGATAAPHRGIAVRPPSVASTARTDPAWPAPFSLIFDPRPRSTAVRGHPHQYFAFDSEFELSRSGSRMLR